ncbi:glycosyltransferase [Acetobacteraceae bacterium KSS8]|uniref:Glycosyltransferase n=1 Tax=Endosaccharibacter trunci TaxID=2812733 RepID=A0ABT1W9H5_9PROT|nr:glycosyltransferase [Acetobacteraceae bacterium KSS8]
MASISSLDEHAPPKPDTSDPEVLERELDRTRLLLEGALASLRLQGMRGDGLQAGLDDARNRLGQLQHSVSWRVTTPLRYARALAAGRLPTGHSFPEAAKRIREIAEDEGPIGLLRRARRWVPSIPGSAAIRRRLANRPAKTGLDPVDKTGGTPDPYTAPIGTDGRSILEPTVLIVAELSIPQCAKYRVWQKQEMFESLGWRCRVINWRDVDHVLTALQLCTHLIFYRVPAEKPVLAMIDDARRLGLDPIWEVDDLIFDEPLYRQNSNLKTLDKALREEVLSGVRLYRAAMLACGRAIASTSTLAQTMRDAGVTRVQVVENALDRETLEIAGTLRETRRPVPGLTTIVYGSGTKTHDADFRCAAPAILRLLQRYPQLRLRIVGELTVPDAFEAAEAQIEIYAGTDYRNYLRLLSEADIAIAPLEPTLFNDAKSNIKFQEAAILGMPSVCSPCRSFAEIVRHEQNGMLAEGDAGWERSLEALILDPALRSRLGSQALDDVLVRYAPDRIAEAQVAALFGPPPARQAAPLRILSANIFFAPQSFGGATIVAQELASRLHASDGVDLCVFTSRPSIQGRANGLLRYDWDGIPVFAASLSSSGDQVVQLDNPAITHVFGQVLDALRPDVVHAHSIQGFGASIMRLCQERGIPTVITLHDPWWLCDRHFMVRDDRRYCFQTTIDLKVCQNCVPHARHLEDRMQIMMGVLRGTSLLLSPSETHRQLYLANGVSPDRVKVNRNGIRLPEVPRSPRRSGQPLRFGYVGGNETIKGFHLIRKAFEALERDDWELVLVDNTLNLGFRSIDVSAWKTGGTIRVVPAYTQESMDAFFDGIDVLLFPSQWKESFGLTVREALARDVWVICTAGGGQAEEIRDGVNGTLIALDGRHEELLAAVTTLLDDPGKIASFRNPFSETLATYDSQYEELLGMIRQVVSEPGSASPPAGRNSPRHIGPA